MAVGAGYPACLVGAKIIQHKHAQRRRQVAAAAFAVDYCHKLRERLVVMFSDFL